MRVEVFQQGSETLCDRAFLTVHKDSGKPLRGHDSSPIFVDWPLSSEISPDAVQENYRWHWRYAFRPVKVEFEIVPIGNVLSDLYGGVRRQGIAKAILTI